MNTGKVNCDTRVSIQTKHKLGEIAKSMSETTGLNIKRSDIQRAAFDRYIAAFDAGELAGSVHQEFGEENGK